MMGNGLTIEATCAACHQPRGWAISAAMTWCELCGACFRCGVRDVAMSVTAHECGKAPVILATGPTHPGYVHSTNLRVEGREAPRRAGRATQLPTPSAYGDDGEMADPVEVVTDPAPDLEACARAAYVASWRGDPLVLPWEMLDEDDKARCREVARAVLAAAKGAGR